MLVLSADTSGKHGSIALVRCEGEALQALELVPLQGGTFSAQLIPQIAELLSKHRLSKSDIDAFPVASGPGSFTGLRVGLAAIKGLAEILQKPIAAVSLLEAMAWELFQSRQTCGDGEDTSSAGKTFLIAMDAGRNEAYVGEYRAGAELRACSTESLLTLSELAARARELEIFTPDENVKTSLLSMAGDGHVTVVERPNAVSVARLGYKKILAGKTVSTLELDANYIRRPDAEIKKAEIKKDVGSPA